MTKRLTTCRASMGDGECHAEGCPNPERDALLGKCPLPMGGGRDDEGPHLPKRPTRARRETKR